MHLRFPFGCKRRGKVDELVLGSVREWTCGTIVAISREHCVFLDRVNGVDKVAFVVRNGNVYKFLYFPSDIDDESARDEDALADMIWKETSAQLKELGWWMV